MNRIRAQRLGVRWLAAALFWLALAGAASAADRDEIVIRCQVFRLTGQFSADVHLDDDIWVKDKPPSPEIKQVLTLLTDGQFKIGRGLLEVTPAKWVWDGKAIPLDRASTQTLANEPLRQITSNAVVTDNGMPASISIGSQLPFFYFEKVKDNLYEYKVMMCKTGLDIKMVPCREAKDRICLNNLEVVLSSVDQREPLGLAFPVGRPIISRKSFGMDLRVLPKRSYGLLLSPGDGAQGLLLIRLWVECNPAAAFKKSKTN